MIKLFLLKPNFKDADASNSEQLYFCPDCAYIEGILSYYPFLAEKIKVIYVDYPRPRPEMIDLLGDDNQSCPSLVIDVDNSKYESEHLETHNSLLYINDVNKIANFLSVNFQIAMPH